MLVVLVTCIGDIGPTLRIQRESIWIPIPISVTGNILRSVGRRNVVLRLVDVIPKNFESVPRFILLPNNLVKMATPISFTGEPVCAG